MMEIYTKIGLKYLFATESPLKMMKNYFVSSLKLFLFSRYLNFCLDFSVMKKNGLIIKTRLISKFIVPQAGKKTVAIHIFPNIARSKDNQRTKFGQLIKYNMRNIFLEKSYARCAEKTISRPFSKKSN